MYKVEAVTLHLSKSYGDESWFHILRVILIKIKYLERSRICLLCLGKWREYLVIQNSWTSLPKVGNLETYREFLRLAVSLLEKRFSDFSMRYNHQKGLLREISEPYSQSFWFRMFGVGLSQIPRWSFFCWSGDHILRITVLGNIFTF